MISIDYYLGTTTTSKEISLETFRLTIVEELTVQQKLEKEIFGAVIFS